MAPVLLRLLRLVEELWLKRGALPDLPCADNILTHCMVRYRLTCIHEMDFYRYPWGKGGCFLDVEGQGLSRG